MRGHQILRELRVEGIREVRGEMRTHFTNLDLSGHHPLAQEKEK